MLSIHILSWNRPFRLFLTLSSLFRILKITNLKYEIIIFDQGSNYLTKFVIKLFKFDKIILNDSNVGMARAWEVMFSLTSPEAEYLLPLENDWWCFSISDKFLHNAIELLNSFNNVAFVKLRSNLDFQAGYGMINKEPQTIYPLPLNIFKVIKLKHGLGFISSSKFSCFTFNPILIRVGFRKIMADVYKDNPNSKLLLRSGEDFPTFFWENQNDFSSANISNAPFKHTGFHSRRYVYINLPFFLFVDLILTVLYIFKIIFKKFDVRFI